MRADTLNLYKLFAPAVRYVVPMFQRPYVWTKDKHWVPLWDDIRLVTERLMAERASATAAELEAGVPEDRTPPHFLGAVVLEQVPTPAGVVGIRHVIDGQQRLTTLQVFIAAFRVVALSLGLERSAKLAAALLRNDELLVRNDDDLYKVWPTNVDRPVFRAVQRGDAVQTTAVGGSEAPPIAEAYECFRALLTDWAAEASTAEDLTARFEALADVVWNLLLLVSIDLDGKDNAQVIFETLNDRGTPLNAADLVKNLVFQVAEQNHLDALALYETYWRPFDQPHWRQQVAQGRLYHPRIDVFLTHWLTLTVDDEVRATEVFRRFRAYVRSGKRTVEEILQDLKRYAAVYDKFADYPIGTDEERFFHVLAVTETTTATPLLLWLFGLPDGALDVSERTRALQALESWLMRRTICRLTSKNYNRLFLQLLDVVRESPPGQAGRVIVDWLKDQTGVNAEWPKDDLLVQSMQSVPMYTALTRARLRLVLESIETHLRLHTYGEETQAPRGLTIEHVLPQAWEERWGVPGGADPVAVAIERQRLVHTIGNLSLVTGKLNPAMSNAPWLGENGKRRELSDNSVLRLNQQLLKDAGEAWNEVGIVERGRKLAALAVMIWPGPNRPDPGSSVRPGPPTLQRDDGETQSATASASVGTQELPISIPAVLFKLGRWVVDDDRDLPRTGYGYRSDISERELYDSARAWWVLNPERARRHRFAAAVAGGLVQGIWEIDHSSWRSIDGARLGRAPRRWAFDGRQVPKDVAKSVIGCRVPSTRPDGRNVFGSGGVVAYWPG
jgi:hypothetical protein